MTGRDDTRDVIARALAEYVDIKRAPMWDGADALLDALAAAGKAVVDVHDGPDEFVAALKAGDRDYVRKDAVLDLAQQWDDDGRAHASQAPVSGVMLVSCARELRALTEKETP